MNKNTVAQKRYPVTHINPEQYVPVEVFKSLWRINRMQGSETVGDSEILRPSANPVVRFFDLMCFPLLMCSVAVLTIISGPLTRQESIIHAFTSPSVVMLFTLLFITGAFAINRIKLATAEKNAGDFALLESARQYLTNRYDNVPPNWENRFISYLSEEPVKDNKFSKEYELKVRNFKGYKVFMIANVDGEAPLKKPSHE